MKSARYGYHVKAGRQRRLGVVLYDPRCRSVPNALKVDPKLYELLELLDATCDGRARERNITVKEIQSRIS